MNLAGRPASYYKGYGTGHCRGQRHGRPARSLVSRPGTQQFLPSRLVVCEWASAASRSVTAGATSSRRRRRSPLGHSRSCWGHACKCLWTRTSKAALRGWASLTSRRGGWHDGAATVAAQGTAARAAASRWFWSGHRRWSCEVEAVIRIPSASADRWAVAGFHSQTATDHRGPVIVLASELPGVRTTDPVGMHVHGHAAGRAWVLILS